MEEINKDLIIEEVPSKKNLLLKIMFIVIAVVGIALICLNFIPVKLAVNFNFDKVQSVSFYQNGGVSTQIWKDSNTEKYNQAVNKIKNTLRTDNLAYALFSGKLFAKDEIVYDYEPSILSNIAMNTNESVKYACLSFSEEQHIMLNGEEYNSNDLSSASKKYVKILIEINNNESLTSSKIYFINSNQASSFHIITQTSGSELFEYIKTFFN